MKLCFIPVMMLALMILGCTEKAEEAWIRINQLGYPPNSPKIAVLGAKDKIAAKSWQLIDNASSKPVIHEKLPASLGEYGPFTHTWRLNFTKIIEPGEYYLQAGKIKSPVFKIAPDVYDGIADYLLKYMRQQRCGFNPFLKDSCHLHDGYMMYGPEPDGTPIDVTGGWHDAADYLQYVTTSANATFNLLFAWQENPTAFKDEHLANGLPGKNGIPDVLDEARWGLDWLLKMHPRPDYLFNQIADDRDHAGFRLPNLDSVVYDFPKGRPVYFVTGEPQGLFQYKNRSQGTSSTGGKFSSAFSIGAKIWEGIDAEYSYLLQEKAQSAYQYALKKPGNTQTAPGKAPYFYEEDNWVDDMELAASQLFRINRSPDYLIEALNYAYEEPHTPWMGADTARHYQWYPFFNIGHFELGRLGNEAQKRTAIKYYKEGIEKVAQKGRHNAFRMGVPFIWCSNNLTASFATQLNLYRRLSGDESYMEYEAAMRDWLLGCNPWGTSMIIGMPEGGEWPEDHHSSLWHLHGYVNKGGLIDGPVYGSIYKNLKGIRLFNEDEMAPFQSDLAVYHDDVGDYSTNEPTMDGSAILMYLFSRMETEAKISVIPDDFQRSHGAIIRGSTDVKKIALVFTGDEHANSAAHITETLKSEDIHGSFFLTGNFYRNPIFKNIIQQLKDDGHYLGAHSDRHLLYCTWANREQLLVDADEFKNDLLHNYQAMQPFGILPKDAPYFLPPYEWYNRQIADWTQEMGFHLINYSPGTLSYADYTLPGSKNYRGSQEIYESIINYEAKNSHGLNGFILLSHIGTHPDRSDLFANRLAELIVDLKQKGYSFVRIDDLLNN